MDPLTDPLMDLLTDPNNPALYIDWIIYILKIWHILYPISMGLKHIQLKFYQHYLVIGITLMMSFLMSDWFLYTLYFCHFLYKVSLGLVKSPANHNVWCRMFLNSYTSILLNANKISIVLVLVFRKFVWFCDNLFSKISQIFFVPS